MDSAVVHPNQAAALESLSAAIDGMFTAGLAPTNGADATAMVRELESLSSRIEAAKVDLLDAVDIRGLYGRDGHVSAKAMVRHVAKLSNPVATRRQRTARSMRYMPVTQAAFRYGRIGSCQTHRLALAHANPRARDAVIDNEGAFATIAAKKGYGYFDAKVSDFVDRIDADGTRDTNQRSHENRDAKLVQDFDKA